MANSRMPFLPASEHSDSDLDLPSTEYISNTEGPLKRRWRRFYAVIRILVVILASWGFVSLCIQGGRQFESHSWPTCQTPTRVSDPYRPETLEPGRNTCDCGTTTQEALSRDCVYDSLAAAWLPPYCRDEELTAKFEISGPGPDGQWLYYADEQGTIPLNKAQLAALGEVGGSFWALRDWHVAHCLFYWQKYTRMRDTGVIMEQRFDHIEHVRHCQHLALKPKPDHFFLINVNVVMNSTLLQ